MLTQAHLDYLGHLVASLFDPLWPGGASTARMIDRDRELPPSVASQADEGDRMALQIARGLFQLWLILSLLWIGAVGIIWRELPWASAFHQNDAPPIAQDAEREAPAMRRVQSADGVIHEFPAGTDDAAIDRAMKEYARWRAIQFAAMVTLTPPAFVLVAGWAFVWAFRGFLNSS
jgi:hypothetical protein